MSCQGFERCSNVHLKTRDENIFLDDDRTCGQSYNLDLSGPSQDAIVANRGLLGGGFKYFLDFTLTWGDDPT